MLRMLRRTERLAAFEDAQLRQRLDAAEALRVFEALYMEARRLGVLPSADPLEGLDVDLRLARALNV